MIIRVRSDGGLWRVPLDDDSTVIEILRTIEESVRPGTEYVSPLSFDALCKRPIDPSKTLKEQGLGHGSMIYCRVSHDGGPRQAPPAAETSRPPAVGGSGIVGMGATAAELRAAAMERRSRSLGAGRGSGEVTARPEAVDVVADGAVAEKNDDEISRDEGEEEEDEEEDQGPPTCRICLGEGTPISRSSPRPPQGSAPFDAQDDRLISPCLCRGTVRYVHISCLQQWRRSAHGLSDSALRCGQCRYQYGVRRSGLALFMMSDNGAPTLAVAAMATAMHILGVIGYLLTKLEGRERLYLWLRLGNHRGGGAAFLRETAYGEIITLGGTALGCLTFANYAIGQTIHHYALYREGLIDASRLHFVGLLLFWIYQEIAQNRSGRGLAVIGLFMACYHSYEGAMAKAKVAAQWLGETILEPTAADRRRHEQEEREKQEQARGGRGGR